MRTSFLQTILSIEDCQGRICKLNTTYTVPYNIPYDFFEELLIILNLVTFIVISLFDYFYTDIVLESKAANA